MKAEIIIDTLQMFVRFEMNIEGKIMGSIMICRPLAMASARLIEVKKVHGWAYVKFAGFCVQMKREDYNKVISFLQQTDNKAPLTIDIEVDNRLKNATES